MPSVKSSSQWFCSAVAWRTVRGSNTLHAAERAAIEQALVERGELLRRGDHVRRGHDAGQVARIVRELDRVGERGAERVLQDQLHRQRHGRTREGVHGDARHVGGRDAVAQPAQAERPRDALLEHLAHVAAGDALHDLGQHEAAAHRVVGEQPARTRARLRVREDRDDALGMARAGRDRSLPAAGWECRRGARGCGGS